MPPGNDAAAKHFQKVVELATKHPSMASDVAVERLIVEGFHVVCGEPTEVTYADEFDLDFIGPALWCLPLAAKDSPNIILYLHGGGYVTHSPAAHRKMAGHFAKAAGVKLIMPDYRLAPEHKFPSQLDDALASYRWLLKKGYKPENIATMGDSAGGNLATGLVLKLRELGEPLPRAIVANSPW
jgi:epsilon-lactone hydrolase